MECIAGFDAQFKAANYNSVQYQPHQSIVKDEDLPTEQIVSLQTSFVTSFVSETRRVRDELKFELHMYSSGSGVQDQLGRVQAKNLLT